MPVKDILCSTQNIFTCFPEKYNGADGCMMGEVKFIQTFVASQISIIQKTKWSPTVQIRDVL